MASICRLCLSSSASHFEDIAAIEEKYFQLILPEIDIQLVQSPMFCQSCIELLQTSYSFKNNCIKTEKMLKLYASNSGEENLLLIDVLQNHFMDKNPVLSDHNDAEDPLNQDIKVECDIDNLGCDLELVEKDLQIWYETEIKFYEEEQLALCESLKNICKESSEDKNRKKLDRIMDHKKPFRCEHCGISFRKSVLLTDHIKRHYERPCCITCDKELRNRHELKHHLFNIHKIEMSIEHKERIYTMNVHKEKLDKSIQKHLALYKSVVDIERGKTSSLEDERDCNRKYKCNVCEKAYHKKKYLLKHITAVHKIDISDHLTVMVDVPEMDILFKEHCKLEEMDDDENKSDTYEDQLDVVKKSSIASKRYKFTCETCGKQFKWDSLLNRHKLMHSRKKFVCDDCQKGFYTKARLDQHISRFHLGIRPKHKRDHRFTCEICGLTTVYKWTLIEHIRKHTGEKPYECHLCDKAFAKKGSLSSHMKTVHVTERLFTCEYCSKSFKMKGTLNKHIRTLHMMDKMEKKFICNYCGKKFLLRCMLNSHLKWHLDDRQFSCDLCQKTFVNKGSLQKHRVTHSREKKFKCEICGKGYHQKSNIKIHMKVHGTHS